MEIPTVIAKPLDIDTQIQNAVLEFNANQRHYDEIMKQVDKMCDAHKRETLTQDEIIDAIIMRFKEQLLRYLHKDTKFHNYYFTHDNRLLHEDEIKSICDPIVSYMTNEIEKLKVTCSHQKKPKWHEKKKHTTCVLCAEHNNFFNKKLYENNTYVKDKIIVSFRHKLFDHVETQVQNRINCILRDTNLQNLSAIACYNKNSTTALFSLIFTIKLK